MPTRLQMAFERVNDYIQEYLTIKWEKSSNLREPLRAMPHWKQDESKYSVLQIRLASIYFPNSCQQVVGCYEALANYDDIETVFGNWGRIQEPIPEPLALFRAITASIVLSVVIVLGGKGFNDLNMPFSWI